MAATLYLDESGYTGTDWANPDQPIFVHGGWLVMEDGKPAITAGVDAIRRRHRLQGDELKWSQVARRRNAAGLFREVFDVLLNNQALPMFMVADKEFIISAKAVETYYDPAYNDRLPNAFAANFARKKKVAEALMGATGPLTRFAGFLRLGHAPTEADVRDVCDGMAAHLLSVGEPIMANLLADFPAHGVRSIQAEFDVDAWMRTTTGHTLFAVIQLLEGFLRRFDVGEVRVVHDNIVRFDALLDMVRSLFGVAAGRDFQLPDGRVIYFDMPTVGGLELADSKSDPFVQLADLFCGFVRVLFTKIKDGQHLSPDETALARDLAVIHERFYTWDYNAPVNLMTKFARIAFAPPSGVTAAPEPSKG